MICVVDTSVAVKWFVAGEQLAVEDHVPQALNLLQACATGSVDLLAPPHFLAEVCAVLVRLAPERAARHTSQLSAMDITWASRDRSLPRAIAIAHSLHHHLFDTLYHALALDTPGAVLVTADRRYFDKARHLGQIEWLADFRVAPS